MKVTKRSVANNAANVLIVLGYLISAIGPVNLDGTTWDLVIFIIVRIGLPVALGVVGGLFVNELLTWYEQTKTVGHGKADDGDKKANENQ